MSIRIMLADDHPVLRSGLRSVLERELDFTVVAEAGHGDDVIPGLTASAADVLVLDLSMPGDLSGPRLAERALKQFHRLRIVILTMHEDVEYLRELLRVGVHGYVLKKSGVDDVIKAIRAAHRGDHYVDARLGGLAVTQLLTSGGPGARSVRDTLTPREQEVCRLLALGHTNVEAAAALGISDRTVETHRTNIMEKLGLRSRAELVRFALAHGLLK